MRTRIQAVFVAVALVGVGVAVGVAIATGAPTKGPLMWSGVVTDTAGSPYPTEVDVSVAFYDAATGGTAKCTSTTVKAAAKTGRFSVSLPSSCAEAVMTTTDLWVQATVGPKKMTMPRQHIGAVPYALTTDSAVMATKSLDLACKGCVSVDELKIDKDLDLGAKALKTAKVDFGPGAKDELTAAHVKTLVGGGNADALHTHAGGGSSGGVQQIVFKGVTTKTFQGNGGLAAMDDACAALFGKARICTPKQLDENYPRPKPGKDAWLHMVDHVGEQRVALGTVAVRYYHQSNCFSGKPFNSLLNSNSYRGAFVAADGTYKLNTCNTTAPVACCGPK